MEFQFRLFIISVILGAMFLRSVHSQRDNQQTKKYCGSQIGSALQTLCKGNYNTLKRIDRFPRPVRTTDSMMGDMPAESVEDLEFPFQSKAEATSLLGGKRRKKRWGVFNECCEKSCTQEELFSYCALGDRKR